MMLTNQTLIWIKRYYFTFIACMMLTLMAGASAVVGVARVFTFGFPRDNVIVFAMSVLGVFIWIQTLLALRAHARALKAQVVVLLICLVGTLSTYKASPMPHVALMSACPALFSLWLMNTRRYRGLWKRLCVMRRRRTRQRRLLRQLKRMRRR